MVIEKIVSGGQTGVDTAALDVAILLGIPHGGWCPRGRLKESGIIQSTYQLKEAFTDTWDERTKLNIRDSDGTLVLLNSKLVNITDGTNLTITEARAKNKPLLIIDMKNLLIFDQYEQQIRFDNEHDLFEHFYNWVTHNNIKILNIAGQRESQAQGVYDEAKNFLIRFFRAIENNKKTDLEKISSFYSNIKFH